MKSRFAAATLGDCLLEGALFQLAAIQNARLVEMDVGLDEATDDETAIELLLPNISSDPRLDYYDAASRDADVAECVTPSRRCAPGAAQDQVAAASYLGGLGPAEIRSFELRILRERGRRTGAHNSSGFEHIAPIRKRESERGHLVHQENRGAFVAQFGKDLKTTR